MSAHTPGPWIIPERDSGVTVNVGHAIVAEVYAADRGHTQMANARLIAAAPELAEALREFVGCAQYLPLDPMLERAIAQGRAALAKAGVQS